mmetsp:Transcript_139/g.303  ORF Transcript_139/g.303 Transcript_139/m.303 type:complete len:216 (-) Transcript_139:357-1004(-)|eukprot:CAMPEP_0202863402 /NCGR_PEP_ID=MMETSP1391-20130828/4053_1 /ASSEMBLY_ACC=CAM_ASM_000867 /TAXON_ID=1034604 /ORGANISM="Chlamydomonas leiostraca, Strain SAG 11-49" /LENGTH=215 /DNA_ID=CAMNT_0049543033 /DNA_START=60 /DNA_END=707 /DNA_ORIENTATION=-
MQLLPLVAVLSSLAYAGIVGQAVVTKYGTKILYVYHPLGGLAFLVFATLGVFTAQRPRSERGPGKHKALIDQHALYQIAATLCALATFGTIYVNKERNGYMHLKSNHGMAGAAVVAAWLCTQMSGSLCWYFPKLLGASLRRVYALHGLFGYAVVLGVVGVHALAVQSGYTYLPKGSNLYYGAAGALAAVVVGLLAGVHVKPLLSPLVKKAHKKTA